MTRHLPFFCLVAILMSCGGTDAEPSPGEEASYRENLRPQLHFSPPANWMNDPNGMVFHEGEYHLFYQYYPDGTTWGPMHWGHAVSSDMVRWENLPVALYPDEKGYIFSGSAVVDKGNTSGFGEGGKDPLVAIFTYHDPVKSAAGEKDVESQAIAYSNDRGRSWTKYDGNPVLPNTKMIRDWRDPKVSWNDEAGQWVLTLAANDRVMFYGSGNLKDWTYLSEFGKTAGAHGGVWECPDLFPLEDRYVLLVSINPGGPNGGSATQYFIGDFDGKTFTPDPGFPLDSTGVWLDHGRDNYAGVTWSNAGGEDHRFFLGWMSNWDYANVVPTQQWRSSMTVPRRLSLTTTPDGVRLRSAPVAALNSLRAEKIEEFPYTIGADSVFQPLEVEATFVLKPGAATSVGLRLVQPDGPNYEIGYDAATRQFFSNREGTYGFSEEFGRPFTYAPRISNGDTLRLRLYIDATSVELFADDGLMVLTENVFPETPYRHIQLFHDSEEAKLLSSDGYRLRSIWE